jgi:hypothetical protein
LGRRTLTFVDQRLDVGAAEPSRRFVVLDTAWTPEPGDRSDIVPVRNAVSEVLAARNLFDESLERLDAWAAAAHAADHFSHAGVTWWYHARSFVRLQVHEMLLWRHVLDLLAPDGAYDRIEVPKSRPSLVTVAEARGGAAPPDVAIPGGRIDGARLGYAAYRKARAYGVLAGRWTFDRLGIRYDPGRRLAMLDKRFDRLADEGDPILAVVRAPSFHVVRGSGGARRMDPYVGPVLERLEGEGQRAIRVALAFTHRREADWALIQADERLLPISYVARRFIRRGDRQFNTSDGDERLARIPDIGLDVDGHDLGPAIAAIVRRLGWWFSKQRREFLLAERLIEALRPAVVFTGWEGARTAWLGAALHAGVPSVAIQHGVIYPNNPEYLRPPHRNLVRPDRTCVYGSYERDILIGPPGYRPAAVVVTGSPRATPGHGLEPITLAEREALRRQLGVAAGDRLLVVSGARNPVGEEFHTVSMLSQVLDGPLPGVHVVFKLHPEESDGSYLLELLDGLARAGGYPPNRASTVRDVDLYQLMRSADAHLGQYSTVLTDAVLTNTPNMIAVGQAWSDVIGHVEAGVAAPVRNVEDVRMFLADPRPADPEARAAFLAEHFTPGDSIGRVATVIRDVVARKPERA